MISHKPRDEKKALFLAALVEGHTIKESCAIAGIGLKTPYDWQAVDPAFVTELQAIRRVHVSKLEENMYNRALTERGMPGVVSGIFLLKAWRPETYRETTRHEIGGDVAIRIEYGPRPLELIGETVDDGKS